MQSSYSSIASSLHAQVNRLRRARRAPVLLELDLSAGVRVVPANSPVPSLPGSQKLRLPDVLRGLERGGADSAVAGLVAKIGPASLKLPVAQELRDAVLRFRAAGKHTVAWSESFGEFRQGTVLYYLASAFEEISLQPSGDVGVIGVTMETPFAREALDRLGISVQSGQRYEYKTASHSFTERGYTAAHRESDERVVASQTEHIAASVAESRGLDVEAVRALMDRAPLLASEALREGLVDRLAYRSEVYEALRRELGSEARLRYVTRYARGSTGLPTLPFSRGGTVALIHMHGTIRLGHSSQGSVVGSATATAALRAAAADERVRAVVLRVESPGGSYAASDAIWHEVARLRRRGKPVVASFGGVAASGGYFVAMGSDVIVAQPGTQTGSIGVFGGKPVVSELLDRLGVSVDGTSGGGRHSRMFSKTRDFTEEEMERLNVWLDRVYTDFVDRAAKDRSMSPERMHELARGRVWTGSDARAHGLVDELGDLHGALAMARRRAQLPADAPVVAYPKGGPLQLLRPPRSSEDRSGVAAPSWAGPVDPLSRIAIQCGLPASGPLIHPFAADIR